MYKWNKKGLLIKPNSKLWWMQSHAMIPTPEHIDGNVYKIYYSGRDIDNRSHIGYAVVELGSEVKVVDFSSEPVLTLGDLGCFDDNGVTPSSIVRNGNDTFLYYIGWNPGSTTRMHIYGGLAISNDNGKTFNRYSKAPIIERCKVNPYINTAPFVLKENDLWRMYYVSGVEWVHKDLPRYNIQYATSNDGKIWSRKGHVAIDFKDKENALARPFVIKEDNKYKMWFASKGDNYRLRYAESDNGVLWERKDDLVGISVSENGKDTAMIEYAAVVPFKGSKYMFYNGNNYGHGGILLAMSEE